MGRWSNGYPHAGNDKSVWCYRVPFGSGLQALAPGCICNLIGLRGTCSNHWSSKLEYGTEDDIVSGDSEIYTSGS